MSSMRLLLVSFLLVPLSGCVDEGPYVLQPVDSTVTWDDGKIERFAQPWDFFAPNGTVVPGIFIGALHPDPYASFVPNDGGSVGIIGKAYGWDWTHANQIGHFLAGRNLHVGMAAEEEMGGQTLRWHVERADDSTIVVNVSYLDGPQHVDDPLPGNFYQVTFTDGIPIPVSIRYRAWNGSIEEDVFARNLTLGGTPRPLAKVDPLPPADLQARHPFYLWEGEPFTFDDAVEVWRSDPNTSDAWAWIESSPGVRPIDVTFTIADENEGNATARDWLAIYADPMTQQRVVLSTQWRQTHPTDETRMRYPLYDKCPDGCVVPPSAESEIKQSKVNESLIDWPSTGITIESAIQRLQALGLEGPTAARWRIVDRHEEKALEEAELWISFDVQIQTWDMEPNSRDLGGDLTYTGRSFYRHAALYWETGDFQRVNFFDQISPVRSVPWWE